jgi:hypothetical protein
MYKERTDENLCKFQFIWPRKEIFVVDSARLHFFFFVLADWSRASIIMYDFDKTRYLGDR